jgi:signal transduction histidine kinase
LYLYLTPLVVIFLGIGVYAIVLFGRLTGSVDASVTNNDQSFTTTSAMKLALAGMDREVSCVAAKSRPGDTNTPAETPKHAIDQDAFSEHRKHFDASLATLLKASTQPGEMALTWQVATNYQAFLKAVDALGPTNSPESQLKVYEQEVAPCGQQINLLLEKIHDLNHQAMLETSQNIRTTTRMVARLMIIGTIIALLASAGAGYLLGRSILRPIQLLTQATREMGEGKLGQLVPVAGRDEVGELALAFNKMAAQLQGYRQSTSEQIVRIHRTMEATLASFPDPVFVLDKEGAVELKNPAADNLASTLRLDDKLPERLQAIARKTLESGENFLPISLKEAIPYRIGGEDKFFLPRVLAMRSKEDSLFGAAVVLCDVTRFRLLDAATTDLVATVSNEFKSPLTSVRMVLRILLEKTVGALAPKQDELLKSAWNNTERLLRILNDLIDLAQVDEVNTSMRKEPVAPSDLLAGVLQEMADKFTAKGLNVNCNVEPDLPPVLVDRQRIHLVFTSLISNAIKHSPVNGEIILRAKPAENNDVEFSITDQGPGLPEEFHSRIFQRFFRVPGQTEPGAGLGLFIAREITVAHGGLIGLKLVPPGEGCTFYVVLGSNVQSL